MVILDGGGGGGWFCITNAFMVSRSLIVKHPVWSIDRPQLVVFTLPLRLQFTQFSLQVKKAKESICKLSFMTLTSLIVSWITDARKEFPVPIINCEALQKAVDRLPQKDPLRDSTVITDAYTILTRIEELLGPMWHRELSNVEPMKHCIEIIAGFQRIQRIQTITEVS